MRFSCIGGPTPAVGEKVKRVLDSKGSESYLRLIPFHRFPAAHSCARRFFVWYGTF